MDSLPQRIITSAEDNPTSPTYEASDFPRLADHAMKDAMLFVTHRLGGGTERHVQHMADVLESDGIPVFFCRPKHPHDTGLSIEPRNGGESASLLTIDTNQDLEGFVEMLRQIRIAHVHIHHLAYFPENAADFFREACARADLQYDVTLHDYLAICPRIFLVDASEMYCGEPDLDACEGCIKTSGSPFGHPGVRLWREQFAGLLGNARRIFVPSADVALRMARFMPNLVYTLRPHPDPPGSLAHEGSGLDRRQSYKVHHAQPARRIGVIGAIGPHKGSQLLYDVARFAQSEKLPVRFSIIGCTSRDHALSSLENVEISGPYEAAQEEHLVARAQLDLAWFPNVIPETYSYTLSTALKTGLFPIAFDFGAIAERLRAVGWGELMPYEMMLDAPAVARRLVEVTITPPPAELPTQIFTKYGGPLSLSYYGLESWPPSAKGARAR